MLNYAVTWISMVVAFLLVDAVWLGWLARSFYRQQIGELMREQIWFGVAGLFYLFYTAALLVLVVVPAQRAGSMGQAMLLGALLGMCAYGTYDVTNLATLKGWPIAVAIVDTLWGTLLSAIVALVGYRVLAWSTGS